MATKHGSMGEFDTGSRTLSVSSSIFVGNDVTQHLRSDNVHAHSQLGGTREANLSQFCGAGGAGALTL